jgi:hypothetical protein
MIIFFKSPDRKEVATLPWKERVKHFDLLGTSVFLPSIICLLLALQWGGTEYAWNNGRVIALLVVFGVLIIIFGVIQIWKKDMATLPPRIIKQRSVAFATWFQVTIGATFLLFVFYVSSPIPSSRSFH